MQKLIAWSIALALLALSLLMMAIGVDAVNLDPEFCRPNR